MSSAHGCWWPGGIAKILSQCGAGAGRRQWTLSSISACGLQEAIPSFLKLPWLSRSAEPLKRRAHLRAQQWGGQKAWPLPLSRGPCQAETTSSSLSPDLPWSLLLMFIFQQPSLGPTHPPLGIPPFSIFWWKLQSSWPKPFIYIKLNHFAVHLKLMQHCK